MKVREFEQYRQYYCGLCRALKERYGRTDILNYDATFIYLLAEGLADSTPIAPEAVRCIAHPFTRHPAALSERALFAADVNALMAFVKAEDDALDAPGISTRLAAVRAGKLGSAAADRMPGIFEAAGRCALDIRALEKRKCASPDAAAHPYGTLLGQVFTDLDVVQSHILQDLGYNLGRWTYLIDAWDDIEDDRSGGSFNVYLARAEETGQTMEELRKEAEFSLNYTLAQAAAALGRLRLLNNTEILSNIVRLGLYTQTRSILDGKGRQTLHEPIRSTRRL